MMCGINSICMAIIPDRRLKFILGLNLYLRSSTAINLIQTRSYYTLIRVNSLGYPQPKAEVLPAIINIDIVTKTFVVKRRNRITVKNISLIGVDPAVIAVRFEIL